MFQQTFRQFSAHFFFSSPMEKLFRSVCVMWCHGIRYLLMPRLTIASTVKPLVVVIKTIRSIRAKRFDFVALAFDCKFLLRHFLWFKIEFCGQSTMTEIHRLNVSISPQFSQNSKTNKTNRIVFSYPNNQFTTFRCFLHSNFSMSHRNVDTKSNLFASNCLSLLRIATRAFPRNGKILF